MSKIKIVKEHKNMFLLIEKKNEICYSKIEYKI